MGRDLNHVELGRGISQRKDGTYEARCVINGQKIDLYSRDLRALKKEFERAKASVATRSCKKQNILLNEWFDTWFTHSKAPQLKSDICRNSYRRKVEHTMLAELGDKRIDEISQMDVQMAVNECLKKYSEKTVREAVGVLRECMDVAIVNHYIIGNPCVSIRIHKDEHFAERRVLSHDEQQMFFDEIQGNFYKEPYMILLQTGMRIGEFSALTWDDVDFNEKCIHINKSMETGYFQGKKLLQVTSPKTSNSYRDIPFFGDVEQEFKTWKVKQDMLKMRLGKRWRANPKFGDLVFTTSQGSECTRYVIETNLKKLCAEIQLKENDRAIREHRTPKKFAKLYPHAFRHTFATRCFEKSMSPEFVQRIMGHSSYNTTLSYTHFDREVKNAEINKGRDFLA